jgi:hypothetical protein
VVWENAIKVKGRVIKTETKRISWWIGLDFLGRKNVTDNILINAVDK